MATREPCATGEWYHCYNRGVDKRTVFENAADYERFIALLYACNGTRSVSVSDRYKHDLESILADESIDRGELLVDIGAYSLMPTHPHLLLLQLRDGGIARFMQKVFTGYTLYFNNKRGRTGSLFAGTYKAKRIADDRHLKQVVPYVLLNPVELFEPQWKHGTCNLNKAKKRLLEYPYSSLSNFLDKETRSGITGTAIREYYDVLPTLPRMLRNAQEYYKSHSPEV